MADERTGIKYIGKDATYKDRMFGTGLVWKQGEILPVSIDLAKDFLKHPALFAEEPGFSYLGVTRSDQGVVFSEPSLNRAVRAATPPRVLADADIDARPPRMWPVDAVPYRLFNHRSGVAYGHGTDQRQLVLVDVVSRAATNGYQFPLGWAISDIWPGDTCMLIMAVETATSTYSLWRTEDGQSVTRVHDLGRDPNGEMTHRPQVRILQRGLERGYLNGQPALLLGTYNVATDNSVAVAGEIGDAIYLAASTDDGRTWTRINGWNWDFGANSGARTIKHFHAVRYDRWRDCWWICSGDSNDESAIIRWDGKAAGPGNVTPAQIASGAHPGWDCRTGSQRWRAVDLLVTEDWVESFTDTIGNITGGIWRVRPDFSGSHRVDHSNRGQNHDGWAALHHSGGTHLWCDDCRADAASDSQRWIGIYASANGNRYWEIGRVALTGTGVRIPRGLFEDATGRVWFSCDGEAGKGTYTTTVMELRGLFREEQSDNLAPVYFVDFATGSNAADGQTAASAWKTVRNVFGSNVVTPGARIVVSAGTSTENGVSVIDYLANASPARDASRRIQISGQGRSKTEVVISGATEGWKDGTSAKTWAIEVTDMTVRSADATKSVIWDNATATGGVPSWIFRDAQIGDMVVGASRAVYLRTAAAKAIRSTIANITNSTKYTLYIDGTATIDMQSSRVRGGRAIQRTGAKITALHCDWSEYATTGLSIDSTATVAPLIANCVFAGSDQNPIVDSSTTVTLDATNCYGNVFVLPAPAGTPDPILPAAGPLDRDPDTLEPFAWSHLCGLAAPVGVSWDYYGAPYRKSPAVGCCEVADF